MVGIVLTGHGRFAAGLKSALDLIAGTQEAFKVVNFEHEVDELEHDLREALDALQDCDGTIVFADLAGGSPFKTAVLISQEYENVEVIAGTNLPMVCEISLARTFGMDLQSLVNTALSVGPEQITRFDASTLAADTEEPDDFSDGI